MVWELSKVSSVSSEEELHGDESVFGCPRVAVITNTRSFMRNLFLLTNAALKASPLPKVVAWFLGVSVTLCIPAPNSCSSAECGTGFAFSLGEGKQIFFFTLE